MNKQPSIAIDVMSSEQGINSVIRAVIAVIKQRPSIHVHLVGNRLLIEEALESLFRLTWRGMNIHIHHTDVVVLQSDDPVWALKHKRGSSTHLALDLVVEGIADSVVSCANTGALVAISRYKLKRLPSVNRLAMVGSFPTYRYKKDVYLCDVGAAYDASPYDLHCQAKMAVAMLSHNADAAPRVGLLNMGTESVKGNAVVKETSVLLSADPSIHFLGSVEGHDIFSGHYDIVICDGFVGNCVLKSCEGTANYIMRSIRKACLSNYFSRIVGGMLKTILQKYAPALNPSQGNGALLLGLNGIVIKSHGNADILGIETAIHTAVTASSSAYAQHIRSRASQTQSTAVDTPELAGV